MIGLDSTLVVGVEDDDETGGTRMYVGHRADGVYAIVEDEAAQAELRRAWASIDRHLVVNRPPATVLWTTAERP